MARLYGDPARALSVRVGTGTNSGGYRGHVRVGRVLVTAVLVALLGAAPARAGVEYTVTDLSAAGQPTRDAWAVNDDGVVVGAMNTGAPSSGFRWTPALGLRSMDGKNGIPLDVNASGIAVGLYDRPQDEFFQTGARWDVFGSVSALLPAADPACPAADNAPDDCDGSYAHGIGADGVAVGASTINGGAGAVSAPAYWLSTATQGIRLQDTPGVLEARNAAGVMVGQDGVNAAVWRALGDKVVLPQLTDGQGQTGDRALARDINNAGVVVGDGATRPGGTRFRAFSWTQAGGIRRLDTLGFGTAAYAISGAGEIVGTSKVEDSDAGARAVRWRDGVIADLNALIPPNSGWTLLEAHDVNAQGWIVGGGLKDGEHRAFLLRPAPALEVKLEGAGVNPFDDTFAIRATITNVSPVPVTGLHLVQPITSSTDAYPPGNRAVVRPLLGPDPALPDTLAPGQTAQTSWLEQADAPGYVIYTVRVAGNAGGFAQLAGSGVEVKVGEPGPLTLGDVAAMLMGQWHRVSGGVQQGMAGMRSSFSAYLTKSLKPFGKKSKLKPSPLELRLARALHLPDDYFAPLPDDIKDTAGLLRAALVAQQQGKLDALKEELGGAKKTLEASAKFLQRWTSSDGISELSATGAELYRMARNGEITGGLVSDSAQYWTEAATNDAARAETQRQLAGLTNDAIDATGKTYDRTVAEGKKEFARFKDTLSRDPEEAVSQLMYAQSKLESEAAIEIAKSMLGDKVLKSVALLRRLDKAGNVIDDTVEAIDDERRLAKLIDDTPAPLTAEQGALYTGMTPRMNERMLGHVAKIEARFPGLDLRVTARPLTPGDAAKFRQGFIPKIEAIPIKKINNVDVQFLGANAKGLNEVAYFKPTKPSSRTLKALSPSDRADVLSRYETRLMESQAMAGKPIKDKVLQKKVGEMRKALDSGGHTFEEKIQGKVIRRTELELGVEKTGNLSLLKNKGLTINGRKVGKKGAGFTGDLDIEAALHGADEIPAGIRGSVQLSLQEALRSDPELPFGYHGWRGFDLAANEINTMLVMSERLSHLPLAEARAEAARLARTLGCKPEDLLRTRRNGFVVTFTRQGIIVNP